MKKVKLRVWAEVSYLVPFEVEVSEAEVSEYLGFEQEPHHSPDEIERALYGVDGLYDEVMWQMPEPDLQKHKLKEIVLDKLEVLSSRKPEADERHEEAPD